MTRRTGEAPHHNTVTCVKHYGCKRVECRDRVRAYQAEWRRNRVGNLALVDAEPVRQHLQLLAAADIGPRRISTLTGLAVETIAGFTRPYGSGDGRRFGRKRKVRPEVAAKILALDPDSITPGVTHAIGSLRRIQALNVGGWPNAHLVTLLPQGNRPLHTLPRQTHLYARTADAIADLYDEIKDKRPERCGVRPASAHRSRLRAQRNNWPTIAYWADRMDVIDDPHFEPMYGVTKREIVAQDANWVMTTIGLDRASAAERLGVSKAYIDHAFRDHPEYAVEAAA
ncbi:hypothetical protein KEF29_03520 [Streptomyces tuirus]|uniref:Uncharacterized protein n=1 Tax=Streptomyces tuirus TaxID=68278 RepID=A0A941FE18_9ACTN|nr:hypothetical protein [Streptomyces tuirus]